MLFGSGLPKKFWGVAVNTVSVLINKCPSVAIGNRTPDDRWFGAPSGYSYLRVFGCRDYAHVKQDKIKLRALKFIMIGILKGLKDTNFGAQKKETRRLSLAGMWCLKKMKCLILMGRIRCKFKLVMIKYL